MGHNVRRYHEAVRMAECATSPLTDRNPKDHIVFTSSSARGRGGGQSNAAAGEAGLYHCVLILLPNLFCYHM
jgi:hypothetical protein